MKKQGSLLLIAVLLTLSILLTEKADMGSDITESCAIVPSTIVSWWPGNGDANDLIDGNDGTAGPGTSYTSGKVGQAFQFDGTAGHINVPDDGQAESLDGFTALSIDAWIHPDSIGWPDPESSGHISAIISKHDTTKANGVSFSLFQYNGKLRFAVAQALNPDREVGVISEDDIPIGSWSHVAAVWGGGTDLALYLNGQEMAVTHFSEGATPTSTADNDVPVNIGRVESFSGTFVGPAAFFDGMIDEVDIFSSALSAGTIESIYKAGSLGKCDPNDVSTIYLPTVHKPKDLIYFDDFSNPSSGWPVEDRVQDRFRYVDGKYEILLRIRNTWTGSSAPLGDISSYTVAADMYKESGQDVGYGLVFERVDWNHFYLFIVFPDSQGFALARYDPGWNTLIPINFSPLINTGSTSNRLEVTRSGDLILLRINGTLAAIASDSTYSASFREVGLYVQSENNIPVAVRYDNFSVWQE